MNTPIELISSNINNIYIKREDLIPYSFGGNKARKARLFFQGIDDGNYDCIVTYGSSSSNHCRVVSNMACGRGLKCYIISPEEASEETYNSKLMDLFGAEITIVPVNKVHESIVEKLDDLKLNGKIPYFIPGGGHGNLGTQAYVNCYEEICQYEKIQHIHFDYIFFASGTGTTQSGLICGQLMHGDERKIVGISIARKNPYGRNVVIESINEYFKENSIVMSDMEIQQNTIFLDDYIDSGYGSKNDNVKAIIREVMVQNGIPLDSTYTGKAYYGMQEYIKKNKVSEKNILFIHTGGTPLFFDDLKYIK